MNEPTPIQVVGMVFGMLICIAVIVLIVRFWLKLGREADESTDRLKAQIGRTWDAYQELDDDERDDVNRKLAGFVEAAESRGLTGVIKQVLRADPDPLAEKVKRIERLRTRRDQLLDECDDDMGPVIHQTYEEEYRKIVEAD